MDFNPQDTHTRLHIVAERLFRMKNEGLLILQKAILGYEKEKESSALKKSTSVPTKMQTEMNEAFSCMITSLNHISCHCQKYHQSLPEGKLSIADKLHCIKYHPLPCK